MKCTILITSNFLRFLQTYLGNFQLYFCTIIITYSFSFRSAWDILKYKFAIKHLSPNNQFLMIFGGSSVTASWDNFYHQYYPSIFENRTKDIFHAMNIALVVHNIAQGTNPCIPSNYCYETMGGSNPDWVGWEHSYDCGRLVE